MKYLIGYSRLMDAQYVITQARREAGLSQAALAEMSGTSRPTLSAYERGRKSPTLDTTSRIVGAAGFELSISPTLTFRTVSVDRGRPLSIPSTLPRLPVGRALRVVELPLHLNWSDRGRRYDLRDRRQRARVYEIVLREGGPDDIRSYIDGALLVDLWDDLVLPPALRDAWSSLVQADSGEEVA